jgi:hypothetical protein
MMPFNRTDLVNLEDMLTSTNSAIIPNNFKNQLLTSFNSLFANAIKDNLQQNALAEAIIYYFGKDEAKKMEITIVHQLWNFYINNFGFSLTFYDRI